MPVSEIDPIMDGPTRKNANLHTPPHNILLLVIRIAPREGTNLVELNQHRLRNFIGRLSRTSIASRSIRRRKSMRTVIPHVSSARLPDPSSGLDRGRRSSSRVFL